MWHKYDPVSLLFEVIHHRLLPFLKKNEQQVLLICLVTAIVAAKGTHKYPQFFLSDSF